MLAKKLNKHELAGEEVHLAPMYGSRHLREPVPRYELPQHQMPPEAAYQLIHDELNLDGNPALNLASFVTTWMEPEADKLMAESFGRNFIDADEYPQTTEIHNRCVNMLANLFHAPEHEGAVGCGTVGSSEAIHLAGLALKWRWRSRREREGKPAAQPNIVMGANVQVCWEKFARYFEVEPRFVPLERGNYVVDVERAMARADENTIGMVGILGSTYTGEYEPISDLNDAIVKMNERTGWDIALHVDGASGAFIAPFTRPDFAWDFRLPAVRSINASGHKYGLVYPGIGWVIWRTEADLPNELIFHVNYLGGDQPTFNLNFSKGAGQVLAQYYNFLRLGREGYTEIMKGLEATAAYLTKAVDAIGCFEILSKPGTVPLVCFRLKDETSGDAKGARRYTVFDISAHLRQRGWIVPAYTLAPDAEDIAVLRVVVRENFSRDMADLLADDIRACIVHLDHSGPAHTGTTHARPGPARLRGAAPPREHAKSHKTARGVC
ncbi:MAG TPA: glutamate decarboxylase [Acidimicrobiales bacterium]|nr:glutamate decarboxylase [Acidimicrobiales bacterium]